MVHKEKHSSQRNLPVILNVKEGLHQDLNAKATEEPKGPNFPCSMEKLTV